MESNDKVPVIGWALLLNYREYLPVVEAAAVGCQGYRIRIKDGQEFLLPDGAYAGPDARLNGVFEIDETRSPCDELQRLFHFVHDTPVILGKAFSTAKPFNCDPLQIADGTNLILYGPTVEYKAFDLYFFKAEADGLYKVFSGICTGNCGTVAVGLLRKNTLRTCSKKSGGTPTRFAGTASPLTAVLGIKNAW